MFHVKQLQKSKVGFCCLPFCALSVRDLFCMKKLLIYQGKIQLEKLVVGSASVVVCRRKGGFPVALLCGFTEEKIF